MPKEARYENRKAISEGGGLMKKPTIILLPIAVFIASCCFVAGAFYGAARERYDYDPLRDAKYRVSFVSPDAEYDIIVIKDFDETAPPTAPLMIFKDKVSGKEDMAGFGGENIPFIMWSPDGGYMARGMYLNGIFFMSLHHAETSRMIANNMGKDDAIAENLKDTERYRLISDNDIFGGLSAMLGIEPDYGMYAPSFIPVTWLSETEIMFHYIIYEKGRVYRSEGDAAYNVETGAVALLER
jgi:hypothetical protein